MQSSLTSPKGSELLAKRNRLQARTCFKALAMFVAAFAIAEVLQRSGHKHPIFLSIASVFACLVYLFCYSFYLSNLRDSVDKGKKHNGINSSYAALLMPVVLGFMIAPLYFQFAKKEIVGAMAATLFAFAAIYGKTTNKDLSKPRHTLAVAVFSLIAASLVNALIFKSSILEIAISAAFVALHAFCIFASAQDINEQAKITSEENEAQVENLNAMDITNSLVGVTLELLKIKKQLAH